MNTASSYDSQPNQAKPCPRCGAPLPPDAPEGLCPRCLGALPLFTETVPADAGAASESPLTPEQLAPYFPNLDILECLGRGGMGVVYKARQRSLGRLVALKLLAPERTHDAAFAQKFEHEARALAALNHPNIVTIHDFGQAGGFFYLLMEYVDGVNLRRALRADRFTPEQALAIVPPVCEALQYAHDHGVVHRDIKPENLLLDREGRVKVADFGIAKMLRAGDSAASASAGDASGAGETRVGGTPRYMAPEQRDARGTDHRADIYSLGVVLYELLTGELPGARLEPPSRKVQIDVRLDAIVLRALEQSPELRFENATAFKTQVETVAADRAGASASPAAEVTQEQADAMHADPANWSRLGLYRCARDPRLMVPKRHAAFGWTANFAHRAAWWLILALALPVIGISRMFLHAETRGWPVAFAMVVYVILVAWLSDTLSRVKSQRRTPWPAVLAAVVIVLCVVALVSRVGASSKKSQEVAKPASQSGAAVPPSRPVPGDGGARSATAVTRIPVPPVRPEVVVSKAPWVAKIDGDEIRLVAVAEAPKDTKSAIKDAYGNFHLPAWTPDGLSPVFDLSWTRNMRLALDYKYPHPQEVRRCFYVTKTGVNSPSWMSPHLRGASIKTSPFGGFYYFMNDPAVVELLYDSDSIKESLVFAVGAGPYQELARIKKEEFRTPRKIFYGSSELSVFSAGHNQNHRVLCNFPKGAPEGNFEYRMRYLDDSGKWREAPADFGSVTLPDGQVYVDFKIPYENYYGNFVEAVLECRPGSIVRFENISLKKPDGAKAIVPEKADIEAARVKSLVRFLEIVDADNYDAMTEVVSRCYRECGNFSDYGWEKNVLPLMGARYDAGGADWGDLKSRRFAGVEKTKEKFSSDAEIYLAKFESVFSQKGRVVETVYFVQGNLGEWMPFKSESRADESTGAAPTKAPVATP